VVVNYLVGVSGGPDSLALLDILRKENKQVIVCHVNYKSRESSDRDEKIVKDYCEKYNITIHTLLAGDYQKEDGNFENWARIKRYEFFKEIYDLYKCKTLYLGHHLDDVIETYYLQKQRNIICDYYGIKENNTLYDMNVTRPLLDRTKEELVRYCVSNNIVFGEDETNKDLKYERNKIRESVLSKLSREEKNSIIDEINNKNKNKLIEKKRIDKLMEECIKGNTLNLIEFSKYSKKDKISILYHFVINTYKRKLSISESRLNDVLKKIDSKKPNIILWEEDGLYLCKEYDELNFRLKKEPYSYTICYPVEEKKYKQFSVSLSGERKDLISVNKADFPITIRNARTSDKKVNKLFKDKKIPLFERRSWPVIVDKNGVVILVLKLDILYNEKVTFKDEKIQLYIRESEDTNEFK